MPLINSDITSVHNVNSNMTLEMADEMAELLLSDEVIAECWRVSFSRGERRDFMRELVSAASEASGYTDPDDTRYTLHETLDGWLPSRLARIHNCFARSVLRAEDYNYPIMVAQAIRTVYMMLRHQDRQSTVIAEPLSRHHMADHDQHVDEVTI